MRGDENYFDRWTAGHAAIYPRRGRPTAEQVEYRYERDQRAAAEARDEAAETYVNDPANGWRTQ